jgi:hypothetical protein
MCQTITNYLACCCLHPGTQGTFNCLDADGDTLECRGTLTQKIQVTKKPDVSANQGSTRRYQGTLSKAVRDDREEPLVITVSSGSLEISIVQENAVCMKCRLDDMKRPEDRQIYDDVELTLTSDGLSTFNHRHDVPQQYMAGSEKAKSSLSWAEPRRTTSSGYGTRGIITVPLPRRR